MEKLREFFARYEEGANTFDPELMGSLYMSAKLLGVEATPLDDRYTMAKVHWEMTFEKEAGKPLDFRFFITYVLFDQGSGPRAAFWISHEDEQQVMREAGLIP